DAYDRDVSTLNLEWARQHGQDCPAPTPESPGFAGTARCAECHDDTLPVYRRTKHAHAFATLVDLGKQYHLNCIGCHVTGAYQPACGQCHEHENSPGFDFAKYLPQVLGPGHGQPRAKKK